MSKIVRDELHQCALNMLQERLSRCTEPQRQLFARVYPKLTQDNIVDAIDLCDRTIRKNEAGQAAQETLNAPICPICGKSDPCIHDGNL